VQGVANRRPGEALRQQGEEQMRALGQFPEPIQSPRQDLRMVEGQPGRRLA